MKGLLILVCALLVLNVVVLLTKPVTAETSGVYKVVPWSLLPHKSDRTFHADKCVEEGLNEYAAQGWEYVDAYQFRDDIHYVFKRR
jgi:hypothetical protein